jgi:hypothetical protein
MELNPTWSVVQDFSPGDPGFAQDKSLRVELNPTWVLPSPRICVYLVFDPGFVQDRSLRVELNPTWSMVQDFLPGT